MATAGAMDALSSTAKPLGREEVTSAVLQAAAALFAEKGPNATSIREVATKAGVNHGLVHRHFGSKRKLLAATLQYLADSGAELRKSGAFPDEMEAVYNQQTLVGLRSTLDGYPVEDLVERRPGADWLLEQVRPAFTDDRTARLAAAHVVALELGWRLMGPSLRVGFGLRDLSADELRAAIRQEIARIVTPR